MNVGQKIKNLRKERGITQAQLMAAVHSTSIPQIERGARDRVRYDLATRLAKFFDKPVAYFLDSDPTVVPEQTREERFLAAIDTIREYLADSSFQLTAEQKLSIIQSLSQTKKE